MCKATVIQKTLSGVAIVIGIFFITHSITCLYPFFIISLLKQWPSFLLYLEQIHPEVFTNSIFSVLYVCCGVFEGLHYIITAVIIFVACNKSKYWKALIVCGCISIIFLVEIIVSSLVMNRPTTILSIAGRLLLTLYVIGFGFYLRYRVNKEKID